MLAGANDDLQKQYALDIRQDLTSLAGCGDELLQDLGHFRRRWRVRIADDLDGRSGCGQAGLHALDRLLPGPGQRAGNPADPFEALGVLA